jgi:hypothetical protein
LWLGLCSPEEEGEREGNESKQEFRVINGLWLGAEEERLLRG